MSVNRKTYRRVAALFAISALATTACLSSGDSSSSSSSGGGGSDTGDKKVEILGAFAGAEQEAFQAALKPFEDQSGIDVTYTGNADFTTLINTKVSSGDTPDIALFPQPGLLLDIAAKGKLTSIDNFLDTGTLNSTLIPGFLDAVTDSDGKVWGAPMRMAVKSLVWVPKKAYEAGGYSTTPKTVQELEGIGDQIKADGIAPWCMGYEAGAGTGWVGTDWIEEFMLRVNGPDVYDQWVNHDIPFNDPQVKAAFDAYQELLGSDDENVLGGADGILNTSFETAGNQSLSDPPKCMMQRQGNFITGFYPDDVQKNLDASFDVLPFPAYEGGYDGTPVLGGGDIAALFNGTDTDAQEVMKFLTSDKFGAEWAQAGGWLSPHKTFDASNYPDETTRSIAKIATSADVFRYDGSDLMPAQVGAASFWQGMVAWISGDDTQSVLDQIESTWPTG